MKFIEDQPASWNDSLSINGWVGIAKSVTRRDSGHAA